MLKTRFIMVGLILALIASLLFSSTAITAAKVVTVDEAMSGAQIVLNVGDSLSVVLNQQTGSTGFSWDLITNSAPNVLSSLGHYTTPPPGMIGQGKDTWTFSALTAGASTLYMEYSQPWPNGTKNARNFTLTVIVSDPAVMVPGSSNLSAYIMIGAFAAITMVLIARRPKTAIRR